MSEAFSKAKAEARAATRAAKATGLASRVPAALAPVVDDRSVRRWYGYYLSVVLPGRVDYKLEVCARHSEPTRASRVV